MFICRAFCIGTRDIAGKSGRDGLGLFVIFTAGHARVNNLRNIRDLQWTMGMGMGMGMREERICNANVT